MKAKRKVYEILRDVRKKKAEIRKEAFLNRKFLIANVPIAVSLLPEDRNIIALKNADGIFM